LIYCIFTEGFYCSMYCSFGFLVYLEFRRLWRFSWLYEFGRFFGCIRFFVCVFYFLLCFAGTLFSFFFL